MNNTSTALPSRVLAIFLSSFSALAFLVACSGGGSGDGSRSSTSGNDALAQPPAAASVRTTLEVPEALATASPFDQPRELVVPPGFGTRLWARVAGARFMARAPNGDILLSVPGEGKVVLLRERAGAVPESFDFVTGLRRPHDIVFQQIGGVTYLYIAETNRVTRSVYQAGETASAARESVIDNLPDSSTPELQGTYGHELKNLAFGADGLLYLSIASSCNACGSDAVSDPVRGAIYQYNADGSGRRLFARGLRNAEGLDFVPGTNTLWVAVNSRDDVKVPVDADVDGDGSTDLGKLLPAYIDNNVPELFTAVRDGGNYGWPFCNSLPNATMTNLELTVDYETNADGSQLACQSVDRSAKGIKAHSAPLGFSFLHDSNVPASYRRGAVVGLHGCWNCTALEAGYKVTYFPFDEAGNAGAEIDLVTGFVTDPQARQFWGRPVDAIADGRGGILISDDYAGAIYQLYPR